MTDQTTARAELRAATHDQHERVDRLFSHVRLDDRQDYGAFLGAQAAAHIPVERALADAGIADIAPDWETRQRADLLRADLATLGLAVPDPAGAIRFESEAALLGGLYVLEGSRLGGTMLKRSVPSDFPTRFLGGGDSAAWRNLLQMLDARLDTALKRSVAVQAARNVFALFEISGHRWVRTGTFG
ncbi:biliverdin-producing heme oxygenase [Sphingomonas sp. PAMC 26605]|uniref:biliverdin-producing heme oxygenase n=1 Tax=Sphingomonas sp. PAMC 26605 TaxID=1112214 RepID=UPI0004979E79|nr:biliverdin-producing heme oxygenase [Sphingomonas sp. PAMC 26605]